MKKTVTIGIAAHNEEKNISFLLESLVKQKGSNFVIEKIIVACDGCTDQTVLKVKEMIKKYSLITLIDDHKRLGKSARMNAMYTTLQTDIFISFDADVKIKDNVLSKITSAFNNPHIGLVGGRVAILPQKTIIGKALQAQEYFWTQVILSFNKGNNVQSHTGPVSAGSKEFLQRLHRPKNIVADDHFLYFEAVRNNFLYSSVSHLNVYINVPQTFRDYLQQTHRFLNSAEQLRTHFGSWIESYYAIPYGIKLKSYVKAFKKYPLAMLLAICLTVVQRIFYGFYHASYTNGIWTTVKSTK